MNIEYRTVKEEDLPELAELYVDVYVEANEKEKWGEEKCL